MTPKRTLPSIRTGQIHQATFTSSSGGASLKVFLIINVLDGAPVEVFINSSKQGSILRGMFDALAILISNALQWGVSVEEIAHALGGMKFEPAGFTQDPGVPEATSAVDWIVQRLISTKGDQ